ncbi:hypothetical protein C5O80_28620 [Burkholderia sp. SRS-46]|nr:hypothetical protein C5O80_28620 [Burkholderia sp. SRS-46]
MSPNHHLAGRERISAKDIAEEQILGLSAGSACGINLKIAEALGRHGVDPLVHVGYTNLRSEFVRTGLGMSINPASAARTMGDQLAFRPLCPVSYVDIAIAATRHNSHDAIVQHFFDAMRHASTFSDGAGP